MIDVNCFIGAYPFRELPHPDPDVLVRVLAREGLDGAWVGHLPTAFHRDVTAGNEALFAALEPHRAVLEPVPAIRPDWPHWELALANAHAQGARAIRAYPVQWGMGAHDARLARARARVRRDRTSARAHHALRGSAPARRARRVGRPERRAHSRDRARGSRRPRRRHERRSRAHRGVALGAHAERARALWWDISWIWGPPEDDLAHLLRTVGADRFLFGSAWPLRLVQSPIANLDLLPPELRPLLVGEVP